jgi:HSP20 family protein
MAKTKEGMEIVRSSNTLPSLWASPFGFMRRFTEEMDRLFEDFGGGHEWLTWPREWGEGRWRPDIEMFEKNGQLVVRADLPGLTKNDVKVDITEDALTIQGEREKEHEEKGGTFYRSERSYGGFYRLVPLPEGVSPESVKATFHDGVLEVTMKAPARPKVEPRHVEIKDAVEAKVQTKAAA